MGTSLPLSKVKKIAKFDPDVNLISSDATAMLTVACESFVRLVAMESHRYAAASKRKTVQKRDFDEALKNVPWLEFLDEALDCWPEDEKPTRQDDDTVEPEEEIENTEKDQEDDTSVENQEPTMDEHGLLQETSPSMDQEGPIPDPELSLNVQE